MNLIPKNVLAIAESSFDAIPGLAYKWGGSQANDPLSGQAFKYYVLLTEVPDLFTAQGFTPEQVYWTGYYWLVYLTRLHSLTEGEDAGAEQYLFKYIEYSPCGWDPYQEVHEAAERAAKQRLRPTEIA